MSAQWDRDKWCLHSGTRSSDVCTVGHGQVLSAQWDKVKCCLRSGTGTRTAAWEEKCLPGFQTFHGVLICTAWQSAFLFGLRLDWVPIHPIHTFGHTWKRCSGLWKSDKQSGRYSLPWQTSTWWSWVQCEMSVNCSGCLDVMIAMWDVGVCVCVCLMMVTAVWDVGELWCVWSSWLQCELLVNCSDCSEMSVNCSVHNDYDCIVRFW